MKRFTGLLILTLAIVLSSCSNSDYLNSIPRNSTAIVKIDMGEVSGVKNKAVLQALLKVSNLSKSGIDLSSNVYLFETVDGNLGLCARVSDAGDLEKTFNDLVKKGTCTEVKERRGFHFTMMNNSWVVGFSDDALLVVGPVTVAARTEMEGKLTTFLSQDEEHGIKSSPMFDKLDSISAPTAMVAQAQALPEKFIAPFTLGAPKDADPSQVLIAAEMTVKDGCLDILGSTFSFNRRVNESLQQSSEVFRPIKGRYANCMSADAMMAMFMNVDGNRYIELLRRNNGFQALLAGVNTAIDMDNIIKSVDGDLAITIPVMSDDYLRLSMAAELAHSKWLADVDYWKKSCPEGGRITDWGTNAYSYVNGTTSFYFGVTPDGQFYSGSNAEEAKNSIVASANTIPEKLQSKIKNGKLVMVVNMKAFSGEDGILPTLQGLLRPMFGDVNTIVYSMK
ncbi:MAG: DUF4836 family protein [Prevotella sp.]|nr:DUF4836 family protein [Prevotella sp.]